MKCRHRLVLQLQQGIIDFTATKSRQKLFSYAVMANILNESFTPILNGIAVSDQYLCVFYMSGQTISPRHTQINKTIRNGESDAFPEVEHGPDNPVASLDYAHVHKSIIPICYNAISEKHPSTSYL